MSTTTLRTPTPTRRLPTPAAPQPPRREKTRPRLARPRRRAPGDSLAGIFLQAFPAVAAHYSTGANPAPNAVKIRVIRVLKPTLTSGKSPTGR